MLNFQRKKICSFFGLIKFLKHWGKEVKAHIPYEIEDISKNVGCIKFNTKFVKNQRECVPKFSCKPETQKLYWIIFIQKTLKKNQPTVKSVNYLVNLVDGLHDDVVDIKKIQNEKETNRHENRKTDLRLLDPQITRPFLI